MKFFKVALFSGAIATLALTAFAAYAPPKTCKDFLRGENKGATSTVVTDAADAKAKCKPCNANYKEDVDICYFDCLGKHYLKENKAAVDKSGCGTDCEVGYWHDGSICQEKTCGFYKRDDLPAPFKPVTKPSDPTQCNGPSDGYKLASTNVDDICVLKTCADLYRQGTYSGTVPIKDATKSCSKDCIYGYKINDADKDGACIQMTCDDFHRENPGTPYGKPIDDAADKAQCGVPKPGYKEDAVAKDICIAKTCKVDYHRLDKSSPVTPVTDVKAHCGDPEPGYKADKLDTDPCVPMTCDADFKRIAVTGNPGPVTDPTDKAQCGVCIDGHKEQKDPKLTCVPMTCIVDFGRKEKSPKAVTDGIKDVNADCDPACNTVGITADPVTGKCQFNCTSLNRIVTAGTLPQKAEECGDCIANHINRNGTAGETCVTMTCADFGMNDQSPAFTAVTTPLTQCKGCKVQGMQPNQNGLCEFDCASKNKVQVRLAEDETKCGVCLDGYKANPAGGCVWDCSTRNRLSVANSTTTCGDCMVGFSSLDSNKMDVCQKIECTLATHFLNKTANACQDRVNSKTCATPKVQNPEEDTCIDAAHHQADQAPTCTDENEDVVNGKCECKPFYKKDTTSGKCVKVDLKGISKTECETKLHRVHANNECGNCAAGYTTDNDAKSWLCFADVTEKDCKKNKFRTFDKTTKMCKCRNPFKPTKDEEYSATTDCVGTENGSIVSTVLSSSAVLFSLVGAVAYLY